MEEKKEDKKPQTWEEFVEKHRGFFEQLARTPHRKHRQEEN